MRNTEPHEVVWVVVALVGLLVNAAIFGAAWRDKQWLKRAGLNGRRSIIAWWHLGSELLRMLAQGILLFAAVHSLNDPPLVYADGQPAVLYSSVTVSISVILMVKGLYAHWCRTMLWMLDRRLAPHLRRWWGLVE